MKIEDILKILSNEKSMTYCGIIEIKSVLKKILSNKKFIEELEKIPQAFWDEVKKKGIIVFSEYTYKTKTGEDECVDYRYIDMQKGDRHIPTLTYQKKKQIKTGFHF